jgi:glutathione peroxidase
MKVPVLFAALVLASSCARNHASQTPAPAAQAPISIYDYRVEGLEGGTINFADFKGKKVLVVNTASKCGYTGQLGLLQTLYEQKKDKLVIVGFPSNDFANQDPGSNEEIAAFCQKNYGVSFPMAAKVSVKGKGMAPIYQWLTDKNLNHYEASTVKWNFQKYLLDERGQLVAIFEAGVPPDAPEVLEAINK